MNISESKLRWRYYGGRMATVAIAVGLFLGTIFLLVGYFVWRTEEDYGKRGVAATAIVTSKDHRIEQRPAGQKGGPKTIYTLHYRYKDDRGQPHDAGGNVDVNLWNRVQKEYSVQIEYLSDQPDQSRIAEGRSFLGRWGYLLALGGGSFLICGVAIFGGGGWFWAGRKARLVRDGEPSAGIVTEHDTRRPGKGNQTPSVRLRFVFTDATGEERTGKSCWLPSDVVPRWPVDEPILVLQDPANPTRFEADIFEARADDLADLKDDPPDVEVNEDQPLP